jgi:hypothetical protein
VVGGGDGCAAGSETDEAGWESLWPQLNSKQAASTRQFKRAPRLQNLQKMFLTDLMSAGEARGVNTHSMGFARRMQGQEIIQLFLAEPGLLEAQALAQLEISASARLIKVVQQFEVLRKESPIKLGERYEARQVSGETSEQFGRGAGKERTQRLEKS